jgi:hypothetical protein
MACNRGKNKKILNRDKPLLTVTSVAGPKSVSKKYALKDGSEVCGLPKNMLFRAHNPLLHCFMGSQLIPSGFFWERPGIFRSRRRRKWLPKQLDSTFTARFSRA